MEKTRDEWCNFLCDLSFFVIVKVMVAMMEFHRVGIKYTNASITKSTKTHHILQPLHHAVPFTITATICKTTVLTDANTTLSSLFFLACITISFLCCKKNPMPYWFLHHQSPYVPAPSPPFSCG